MNDFVLHITNHQTKEQTVALLFWGFIGFILSSLLGAFTKKNEIKKSDKKEKFYLGYWIKRNTIRMGISLIAITIGALFSKDIIGKELGNFSALLAGLATDRVVAALMKFKAALSPKE